MTTAGAGAASAVAETVEKPPRKFPPPCWTQEETLALIDAYRERWYALRRGYLRTADWDAVAASVASRCPDASPAKTSAQCRHKMEKLRQRYRADKQRSLSYPAGRFYSSWFFFDHMDAMENGTSVSTVRSNEEPDNHENPGNGFRLKTFSDKNILKLKLNPENIAPKLEGDICPKFASDNGFGMRSSTKIVNGRMSSNIGSKVLEGYSTYLDEGSDKEEDEMNFDGGLHLKNHFPGTMVPSGFKGKNFGKAFGHLKGGFGSEFFEGKGFDASDGFHTKSLGDENLLPPRFRAKKFGKIDGRVNKGVNCGEEENNTGDANVGFWIRVASGRNSVTSGLKGKYGGNLMSDIHSGGFNGFSSPSRLGVEKRDFGGGINKRERDPIEQIVMSIKILGEDFVKMEKMKMEMAMEIEKNRMDMEMKRNELLLESQQQIVDAFVEGLSEFKKKKVKMAAGSEL